MAKKLILVACATLCTLTQKFVQGVEYTEEQVGNAKDLRTEDGDEFFEELDDEAPKRTLNIGGKGKRGQHVPQEDRGPAGGEDGNTISV